MIRDAIILMYHSIGSQKINEKGADLYSVSEQNFREQIEFLRNTHNAIHDTKITFDDGLLNNYTIAYPILKEAGLKAYFFVIATKIGTPGYMSWKQIKELSDAGMIIGSHGMTHKILVGLHENELDYELRISKKILEENLGQSIDYFSIPRGFCNDNVIKQAKENNYKAVFTSNPKDNDGLRFGRIAIKGDWNLEHFIKVLNDDFSFKDKTKKLLKDSSKIILGAKNYDRLRAIILKK
jgi:peptidoglycan/xylan/chitin deacetylase (PgdA/CDA1 family)